MPGGVRRQLTDDQLRRARELFAAGWKTVRVGAELGVSVTLIERYRASGELPEPQPKSKGRPDQ